MLLPTIFLIGFLFLCLIAMPVALALGISTVIAFFLSDLPIGLMPARVFSGMNNFILISIPFFILSGELMESGGIIAPLIDLSKLLFGRIKGGLLHMNIFASMVFGGINGSAVADTSAIGAILIPPTIKEYKNPDIAAAVTACSSIVGPIIPPSLPMIFYAFVAGNVSIAGLFLGGVVPGIILGLGMMAVSVFIARANNFTGLDIRYSGLEKVRIIRDSFLPALLPIILVGGIVSGAFTAAESSCVAVLFALFVGFGVTKKLTFKGIYEAFIRTAITSGVVFIIISMATLSTFFLNTQQVAYSLSVYIQELTSNAYVFLFLMVLLYLIVGLFMETSAAIVMLVPIFSPLATSYGIDPIHFGLVTCLALLLGLVTPPVGLCLSIAGSIAGISVERVFIASVPYLAINCFVLLIVAFFPAVYIWVPKLFGF